MSILSSYHCFCSLLIEFINISFICVRNLIFFIFTHTHTYTFLSVVSEYFVTPETRQLNLSLLVKREKVRRAGEKQRNECGKKKKKRLSKWNKEGETGRELSKQSFDFILPDMEGDIEKLWMSGMGT